MIEKDISQTLTPIESRQTGPATQAPRHAAAYQVQLPELARTLFSTQLEQLDARIVQIPYGIMGRIDNPDSWGWYWACLPYPDVLVSCLRMTARRSFVLREDPEVDYTVVSLLSSSDARLMNEHWQASASGRGEAPFSRPIHPVLDENVTAFPMAAGHYDFALQAGSVHDDISVCLLPSFVQRLGEEDPSLLEAFSVHVRAQQDLNGAREVKTRLKAINPARALRPGAAAFFRARTHDVLAALVAALASGDEQGGRGRPGADSATSFAQVVDAELVASLSNPPSLEELAGRLFIGRSKLCAAYRAETGLTVGQRLVELRMEQAKAMLEHTEVPVEKIARSVGYAHQSSFATAFKLAAGCTPTQWRAAKGAGVSQTS